MLDSSFFIFIIIAILVETLWDTFKMVWQDGKVNIDRIGVMVIAVFVCVTTNSDLFKIFGVILPWSSGAFFSGIIASRGANVLHDLFARVQGPKEAA